MYEECNFWYTFEWYETASRSVRRSDGKKGQKKNIMLSTRVGWPKVFRCHSCTDKLSRCHNFQHLTTKWRPTVAKRTSECLRYFTAPTASSRTFMAAKKLTCFVLWVAVAKTSNTANTPVKERRASSAVSTTRIADRCTPATATKHALLDTAPTPLSGLARQPRTGTTLLCWLRLYTGRHRLDVVLPKW